MAWCAGDQLRRHGTCRYRYSMGVPRRCPACPLYEPERAEREMRGEGAPPPIGFEIRLGPNLEAMAGQGRTPHRPGASAGQARHRHRAGVGGGVRSHTRKALSEGIDPEAIRRVAVLAIPTAGYPAAMASYGWINEMGAVEG